MTIPPGALEFFGQWAATYLVDQAAGKVADWWKASATEKAISATTDHYKNVYEGLGVQLASWSRAERVAVILKELRTGEVTRDEALESLSTELEESGFVPVANGPGTATVLGTFFEAFSREHIKEEGNTHSVARLEQTFKATTDAQTREIKGHLEATLRNERQPPMVHPVDVLDALKGLLEDGKAEAVLGMLTKLEPKVPNEDVAQRYEIKASRANAFLQLERYEEAEECFRDALSLRSDRANALANVGVALLYQRKFGDAITWADKALNRESTNSQALRVKTEALWKQDKRDAALTLAADLPEGWEKNYFLGTLRLWNDDSEEAVDLLEKAYSERSNDPYVKLRLAIAVLGKVKRALDQQEVAPWGNIPEDARRVFARAETLLDSAVTDFSKRSGSDGYAEALTQRALLRQFLGQPGAEDDLQQAWDLVKPDDEVILKHAANCWNSRNLAEKTLSAIGEFEKVSPLSPSLVFHHANALALLDRADEAVQVITKVPESDRDTQLKLVLVDCLGLLGRVDDANEELDKLPDEAKSAWLYTMRIAELEERRGAIPNAIETVKAALPSAPPNERWRLHLLVANLLVRNGEWGVAADHFDKVVTVNAPNSLRTRYLASLFNSGRVGKFFEFLQGTKKAHGFIPQIAEIEAHALESLGRLDECEVVCKEILATDPENQKVHLRLAWTYFRRGDKERALAELPTAAKISALDWEDGMRVAFLHSWLEAAPEALEAAYRVLRANLDIPEAHLAYVGVFMSVEPLVEQVLKAEQAEAGTWVTVEFRGAREVHKLLDKDETQQGDLEHRPEQSLFKQAQGKKVSEEYAVNEKESARIIEIRSKYTGLFQDVFKSFESRFPQTQGLRAYAFRGIEDVPAIQEVMAAKRERAEKMAENYRSLPMPAAMLGKLLGSSDVDAWYALVGHREFWPVLVAEGDTPTYQARIAAVADGKSPLVLETTSIVALAELELLDILPKLGRVVIVPQTVVDQFQRVQIELAEQLRRGGHMSVEERGGKLYRRDVTSQELERAARLHETILEWLRDENNCKTSGVKGAGDSVRWSLREMLSTASVDSVILTQEHGGVLITEDLRLRGLGATEFGIDGAASPHVIAAARSNGVIDQEREDQAAMRMVRWGYHFVPINDRILHAAFHEDNLSVGPNFEAVVRQLADTSASLPSAVNVAALYIKRLKLNAIVTMSLNSSMDAVLVALSQRGQWPLTERLLDIRLDQVMSLMPRERMQVAQEIATWKRARLLP